jgi:P-type Ca2+ transporter type 2C
MFWNADGHLCGEYRWQYHRGPSAKCGQRISDYPIFEKDITERPRYTSLMSSLVPLHAMTPQDALRVLGSTVRGLSTAEAAMRLKDSATWRVEPPKPTSVLRVLGRQCASPFVFVLCGAAAVSWWGGDILDAGITLAIVAANIALGFFQEFQADRAFYALQHYLPTLVSVRRDGVVVSRSADALVPGDVLILRAGQNIVADGRVLDATNLTVSEAALSGESRPIEKTVPVSAVEADVFDRKNMVYAGTSVMSGQGTMVVSAIGTQSEFGKISTMTAGVVNQESPLEGETRRLARFLTMVILLIAVGMFALAASRGIALVSALTLAAALAIAAIPEGLPMTLTVLLSAAMRRMLKRGVLVRHLVATETLGCVNVLCVDKTGTMTTGVMTVVEVNEGVGSRVSGVGGGELRNAMRAIGALHRAAGDGAFAGAATAGAIARYVEESGVGMRHAAVRGEGSVECIASLPFDPAYRFSACRVDSGATYVMGAPDALIPRLAGLHDRESVKNVVDEMASRGLRVVVLGRVSGVGSRVSAGGSRQLGEELAPESITNIQCLGCVGIEDPLRESVPGAIAMAARAGIRTIMMTGDHPETAKTIGAQAFDHHVLTVMLGEDFAKHSAADRLRVVREVNVFARMLPEHKLLVVEALHANGLRVAMTGDGVNDAPALKAADVGIAVGHATEVAKEASDLVLVDGDFGNIVRAVEEGRAVFTNARNVTVFLLALGLGEVFCIVASFLFGLPLPLTPLLILWLNVVTDGIPGLFFAFEGADPAAMQEPPRRVEDGIISAQVRSFFTVAAIGLLTVSCSAFVIARMVALSALETRSATYLGIGILGVLFIFVTKSLRRSFLKNLLAPSMLRVGAAIGLVFLVMPLGIPQLRVAFGLTLPSWPVLAGIVVAVMAILVFLDIAKYRFSPP